MIPELIERYIDTGVVRYVYREFPLPQHPAAQKASEAALCAGEQGHYWEMNEHLFATVSEWGQTEDPSFEPYAQELGLDTQAFDACLDAGSAAVVVQGDRLAGETFGVDATPYFFVNDIPFVGSRPIDTLGRIIEYAALGGGPPEIVPMGEDFHVRGSAQTAQAVTVAFVDYASAESAQHALEVLPQLLDTFVDAGDMLYVLHPWAEGSDTPSAQAAATAECAGEQGKYWEMHDQLFDQQATWTAEADPQPLFASFAGSLGLDSDAFEACLDSDWATLHAQAGSIVGEIYGVPGAPIYLFNNGEALQETPTFEEFQAQIDSILSR